MKNEKVERVLAEMRKAFREYEDRRAVELLETLHGSDYALAVHRLDTEEWGRIERARED